MNLEKCDRCGKRNIMCWNCEKNSNYQESTWSHDALVKRDAIREFSEQIRIKSSDILVWLMERQEKGYGTTNGELHNKWLDVVDEIAEQILADRKGVRI